ncbi:DUF3656 domain-containing protein [Acidaminococcus intestini]|nr:DUF3656 domain-containing protein [Acidaminococcus intestini]
MTITATDDEGHTGTAQTRFIVERARKHALDETVVRKQVDRLGNTEFSLGSLLLTCDDNVMVPMSEINEARRLSVEALTKARLEEFCPPRQKSSGTTAICPSQSIIPCVAMLNCPSMSIPWTRPKLPFQAAPTSLLLAATVLPCLF